MPNPRVRPWPLAALLALFLTACPGGGGGGGGLSITPGSQVFTAGDAPVIFTATGSQASSSLTWTLDPATAGTLSGTTGLSVQFTPAATVPAAVTATLTAAGAGGNPKATASLTVNPVPTLTVDSVNGNDANDGSQAHPFKTVKQALTKVKANGTIVLMAGTFDGASGETWNYHVPDKVTLKANSSGVIFSTTTANTPGLVFDGDGGLRFVTMNGFSSALSASQGQQVLAGVTIHGTADGQRGLNWTGSAAATLTDCVFTTTSVAAWLSGSASLDMTGGSLADPRNNLIVQNQSRVNLKNVDVSGGTFDINQSSTATLDHISLHDVPSYAIYVRSGNPFLVITGGTFINSSHQADVVYAENASIVIDGASFNNDGTVVGATGSQVTIRNSSITQAPSYALYVGGGTKFTLRNTYVAGNAYGISISDASGGVDLGTASDPGGNTFQDNRNYSNSSGYNLGGNWGGTYIVQAVGNTWNANLQGSDGAGHYGSQLLVCAGSYSNSVIYNSYCTAGSQIQY
ncbi:MAG TPA: right-handed parallel beta-helix repeat-containing protein [Deinococcales bacterium]|nr:right-handed parallel beta-helix repeat-containing protein [Deinococcales bacterium]